MLEAERQRLTQPAAHAPAVRTSLGHAVAFLQLHLAHTDDEIGSAVAAHPVWAPRNTLLQSVPRVGPTIAPALLGWLPELGHLTSQQIGKLDGVVSFNRDSGRYRETRRTEGRRAAVHANSYMGAPVAVQYNGPLKASYLLLANGKSKNVALDTCSTRSSSS